MNIMTGFIAAVACALPLAASAQTVTPPERSMDRAADKATGKVLPADQPRSESERKATTESGQAPKYGQTDPSATDTTDNSDMSKSKTNKRMNKIDKTNQTAPGDTTTYPAKTKDGRSTGDSNITK